MKAVYRSLLLLCVSLGANSADLVIDGSGQLLGATDVDVGGTLYDVQFVEGSCNSLFNNCIEFAFTSLANTTVASEALLDQVLVGVFDFDPTLTYGIEQTNGPFLGQIWTPYSLVGAHVLYSGIQNGNGSDTVFNTQISAVHSTADREISVYAMWTVSGSTLAEGNVPMMPFLLTAFLSLTLIAIGSKKSH